MNISNRNSARIVGLINICHKLRRGHDSIIPSVLAFAVPSYIKSERTINNLSFLIGLVALWVGRRRAWASHKQKSFHYFCFRCSDSRKILLNSYYLIFCTPAPRKKKYQGKSCLFIEQTITARKFIPLFLPAWLLRWSKNSFVVLFSYRFINFPPPASRCFRVNLRE